MITPHRPLTIALVAATLLWGDRLGEDGRAQSRYREDYPRAASKKGLQVEDVDDALALGIKHAAINVDLAQLVDPSADPGSDQPQWASRDAVFHFHAAPLERLDRTIKTLSEAGVLVHVIVLAYESPDPAVNRLMLHPRYASAAPNRLGLFNAATSEGQLWLTATLEFLAERWSRTDRKYGRVAGYIIGNEVNSHWWWSNRGRVEIDEFVRDYLAAVRLMHEAVRSQSAWARVYVSLEHHWSIRYPPAEVDQAFPGRQFLDVFAARARAGGDFDWHVAFHSYPENLFEPRFWLDATALPTPDTPRITFKNLDVLTTYLRRPELLYDGKPRRIILSEQGFHTPDGPEGESVQAAAYCYAYKIVDQLEGVDAFILHRHIDHPHEGGLRLGVRRRQTEGPSEASRKRIYECLRLADTPQWEAAFQFALPIVGLHDWDSPTER